MNLNMGAFTFFFFWILFFFVIAGAIDEGQRCKGQMTFGYPDMWTCENGGAK